MDLALDIGKYFSILVMECYGCSFQTSYGWSCSFQAGFAGASFDFEDDHRLQDFLTPGGFLCLRQNLASPFGCLSTCFFGMSDWVTFWRMYLDLRTCLATVLTLKKGGASSGCTLLQELQCDVFWLRREIKTTNLSVTCVDRFCHLATIRLFPQ